MRTVVLFSVLSYCHIFVKCMPALLHRIFNVPPRLMCASSRQLWS